MADQQKYSNSFEPILLEGHTATLYGSGQAVEGLNVVCKAVGALPEYQKDFGALTAATWDTDNEDTNLEIGTMELAQYRMRILDDMQVRLKNPSSVQQWRTNKTNFYLPMYPQEEGQDWLKNFLWKVSEFFVFEDDNTPRFDLYSAKTLATSRVLFSGWKFKLQKISGKGRIDIWINAWPSQA